MQWITVVNGKFVSNKKECADVVNEVIGKVEKERVPWKMTQEEKKRKAAEGERSRLMERIIKKFHEEHNEDKVKSLSMEFHKMVRNDESKAKTRGDSQIEREVEKEAELQKNIIATFMEAIAKARAMAAAEE